MLPDGKFFKVSEFACPPAPGEKYPDEYPFQWEYNWSCLIVLCDAIRGEWGSPLTVISGYRSPAYNAELIRRDAARGAHGVASGSQHCHGKAADLRPVTGTVDDLHILILNMHELGELPMLGGLGIYLESNWVHVDTYVSPDKHLRLWTGV